MDFIRQLTFASDADILALAGAALIGFAVLCQLFDRLRESRRAIESLERVGVVPWAGLSIMLGLLGGILLLFSLPVVLSNL